MDNILNSSLLKKKAIEIGLDDIGIAPVSNLNEDLIYLQNFLKQGRQAEMSYLARNPIQRANPALVFPSCKSILVTLIHYGKDSLQPINPHIALFAQGEDYHIFIKKKLFLLQEFIQSVYPLAQCRCLVDTAPILEKAWAQKAGLGHIGRNTLLLHPRLGSFCLIGILLCNLPCQTYDHPLLPLSQDQEGHPCFQCHLCQEACPGSALQNGMNASHCLSYLTIEDKGERPALPKGTWFGCDRCQNACPCNKKISIFSNHKELEASPSILNLNPPMLFHLEEAEFQKLFKDSPLSRAGLEGLKKNMIACGENS
ncbi:MAG: tRNA epoxyqueuosine(34) reductase QueG [Bacteroidales bacterium]